MALKDKLKKLEISADVTNSYGKQESEKFALIGIFCYEIVF
jgi:hypothetical protein